MQATSTIQANPLDIMDASLNSSGGFNPSPVHEYPQWPLYGVNSLPLIAILIDRLCKTQHFFTSYSMQGQMPKTIPGPSPNEELYGNVPHVNAAHNFPFPESTQAQLGEQQMMMGVPNVTFHNNFGPSTSSIVPEPRRERVYTCQRCDIKFYTSQAYGGHMSSHSKAKNKIVKLG